MPLAEGTIEVVRQRRKKLLFPWLEWPLRNVSTRGESTVRNLQGDPGRSVLNWCSRADS